MTPPTTTPPPRPPPRPPIVLLICVGYVTGLFGYVFEYDLCKIINENDLKCKLELYFENVNCEYNYGNIFNGYYPAPYPAPYPTPRPTPRQTPRPTPIPHIILFILFNIGYLNECDLNNVENVNLKNDLELECELEFENEMLNEYGDIFNGYYPTLYPTPHPIPSPATNPTSPPRPTTLNFINSRGGLREQLVLKGVFNVDCNRKGFDYDLNNDLNNGWNENFCNNGYCYPTKYATPTLAPTIAFNGIDTGLSEINILNGLYGVNSNGNNNIIEICNEINNSMIFFFKFCFSLFSFQFVELDHYYYQQDHSLFVFFKTFLQVVEQ